MLTKQKFVPHKGNFIILLNFIISVKHKNISFSTFRRKKYLLTPPPPNVLTLALLKRCLILPLLLFLFGLFFLLYLLFLFVIFFWFFIFTTPILFSIHMMTKIIYIFYMAIIHIFILRTEPFVPLDNFPFTYCSWLLSFCSLYSNLTLHLQAHTWRCRTHLIDASRTYPSCCWVAWRSTPPPPLGSDNNYAVDWDEKIEWIVFKCKGVFGFFNLLILLLKLGFWHCKYRINQFYNLLLHTCAYKLILPFIK